jgi:hypothetical protein
MHERIAVRLAQLQKEFEAGHAKLQQLEAQETFLRERLLMIKGAIQVLEEMQAEDPAATDGAVRDGTAAHP